MEVRRPDVITAFCNTGSAASTSSQWPPHCPCRVWIRLRRAAGRGGRGADRSTADPPRSPTAADRRGNEGPVHTYGEETTV